MKKVVLFLILSIVCSISKGQLFPPVQQYNESGYTVKQFENFALGTTDLSCSYRAELLYQVNQFLQKTGLYTKYNNGQPLDDAWVSWIFCPCRTWAEHRVYSNGFWNTHQSSDGKKTIPYWDKNKFEGMIMVLHLDGYELDLAKTICMNLVKVPYEEPVSQQEEKFTQPSQVNGTNWTFREPERVNQPYIPITPQKEEKKFKVGFVVIPLAAILAGTTAYLLLKDAHHGHPGGAPPVKPVDPIDPGGPGGAPPSP
ncbi:MAG TPA: hypothetical protein VK153_03375 [Candidatus Paceibacterota bacterium]|nr:hypothetical protein [Candidatus Paceibacterota bacterium]